MPHGGAHEARWKLEELLRRNDERSMPAIDNARLSVGEHVVEGVARQEELAEFEEEGVEREEGRRGEGRDEESEI